MSMDAAFRDAERVWRSSGDLDAAEALLALAGRSGAQELVAEVLDALVGPSSHVPPDERVVAAVLTTIAALPPDCRLMLAPVVDRLACAGSETATTRLREWWPPLGRIVGQSPSMRRVRALAARYARESHPVLLVGESGVGHEFIARAIHELGGRGELGIVHAAAFTDPLFLAELDQHTPHEGTLYLAYADPDERPTRAHELCRTRGSRLLVGTCREASDAGWRRELAQHPIEIPALRERFDDLRLLVSELLRRQGRTVSVPEACLTHLRGFEWGGNVRHLDMSLRRLLMLAGDDDPLEPAHWEHIQG
ncbi:MAG: sigma 54-interacting transcriptional regulator [Planctomycetes bacterium]|nr:sigma 54-interacting transcriptional regulator [Planctomycetota bacterium]